MTYKGDFDTSAVIYGKFTTYQPSTGAAFALAGTPALSVYKDNSTTQSTSGVTLTASFDSVTGLNHYAIDTSSDGTFYSAGSVFDIVITTGTVDGVSVVGSVVGSFSIRKNSSLKPTTAGRTLDVSSTGEAGIDWANIGSPTTAVNLSATNIDTDQVVASVTGAVGSVTGAVGSVTGNVGGNVTGSVGSIASGGISEASYATTAGSFAPLGVADQGTAQAATSTTLQLRSAAAFADDTLIGCIAAAFGSTQGYWQFREITDYVGSTDTATVDAWQVTPSGTVTYKILAGIPAPATPPAVNVTHFGGSAGTFSGGRPEVNTTLIEGSDATNQIRDAVVDDATRIDASALNTLSSHDPGEAIMGATDLGTGAGLTSLASATDLAAVDTVVDTILADTNELQTDWANGGRLDLILDARASQTSVDDLPTNSELSTALAAADDAVLAAIAALNNLSAAQVNAEVVDALATDTYAEPAQGAPGATVSLAVKINYLYKFLRNRVTQTATTFAVYADDATTVDHKAAVSDDGTTFSRGEIATGP